MGLILSDNLVHFRKFNLVSQHYACCLEIALRSVSSLIRLPPCTRFRPRLPNFVRPQFRCLEIALRSVSSLLRLSPCTRFRPRFPDFVRPQFRSFCNLFNMPLANFYSHLRLIVKIYSDIFLQILSKFL